jgi:Na+-translocating ferredoxin:NAD+ oxidoreductase RnfD subunit
MTAPTTPSPTPASPPPAAPAAPGRHVTIRGREVPVVLPNRRDPRMRLSAVIMTLQVLGQTVLGFKLSIAQILVTIGVCGLAELVMTYRRDHTLVWPASGILTGNSISFILRASGTQHGDWWSLHGIHFFILAAVVSLLGKHLIRPTGRHLFNPSNVGIVWVLLVIGPKFVFPQYLWWGPNRAGVTAAYAVILVGGVWVLKKVRMLPMAVAFLATFGVLVAAFALAGRDFIAIWHQGPIRGLSYWVNIVVSPEVLVFVFFMISDPQTAPKAPRARIAYGMGTAVLAAALLYFQHTEFGVKLSILSSLTLLCALVPFIEKAIARKAAGTPLTRPTFAQVRTALAKPAVVAALIVAVAAPIDTARLVGNHQLTNIELGQTGRNPQ